MLPPSPLSIGTRGTMRDERSIRAVAWGKLGLLLALLVLFGVFLALNMGAVIEPRVHLVFLKYERPALLMVLLFAVIAGFTGGLLLRTVLAALRGLREDRRRSGTERLEREVAGLKTEVADAEAERARVRK